MPLSIETVENCFRSYIWKPPEGFSESECLEVVAALDIANRATTQFLQGEIDETTFLDIKEWAHGLQEMDEFIESSEQNVELILSGGL